MGIELIHEHAEEFILDQAQVLTIYFGVLLALLGMVWGSFADCAVSRWAAGEPMFAGRSRCLACGHTLGAADLIPVFSFALRRGRCRWCGEKIPAECLAAELLGAAGFVLMLLRFSPMLAPERWRVWQQLSEWLVWWALLLVVCLADMAKRIIPNWALLALAVNRALWFVVLEEDFEVVFRVLKACLIPAALLALVLLAEKLMDKEVMGGGDIKLLFALALYLSWAQLLLALLAACLAGLAFAALAGRKRGAAIPFGPFLTVGAAAVVSFGDIVLLWYFGLF